MTALAGFGMEGGQMEAVFLEVYSFTVTIREQQQILV
jgi:hypothetical protein